MRRLGALLWHGRWWIEIAVFFFVVGVLLGLTAARTQAEELVATLQPVFQRLGGLGQEVRTSPSPLDRAWIIFQNNARVMLVCYAGGLVLGLLPVILMLVNGMLLGIVIGLASQLAPQMASPGAIALALLPHGVLELPALFIGAAWSMKLGMAWLLPSAQGRRVQTLRQTAGEALAVLALVMTLLFIAALIEGNITLNLVGGARAA